MYIWLMHAVYLQMLTESVPPRDEDIGNFDVPIFTEEFLDHNKSEFYLWLSAPFIPVQYCLYLPGIDVWLSLGRGSAWISLLLLQMSINRCWPFLHHYKDYLVAKNACRWKYRRINLWLRHSNNADKKFQQFKRLIFSNHPIRYSTETTTVIWISTKPISYYYGDTEKVITF